MTEPVRKRDGRRRARQCHGTRIVEQLETRVLLNGTADDTIAPVLVKVQLSDKDRIVSNLTTLTGQQLTTNRSPDIDVTVMDQTFELMDNQVVVELVGLMESKTVTLEPGGATEKTVTLTASNIGTGTKTVTVRATDLAGNQATAQLQFTVTSVGVTTPGAPGTPVFSTLYNIGAVTAGQEQPFTATFDRTTQTTWFSLQEATRVAQFDPAQGKLYVYALPQLGSNTRNPHGTFFDFETHVTPRVWFVHQNPQRGTTPAAPGRITYLDLANNELVTYDLTSLETELNTQLRDIHAIVSDRRGNVWVTSEDGSKLLEIDFDQAQGSGVTPNSDIGTITVRDLTPIGLSNPHGIDVVVDTRPGRNSQPYVWLTERNTSRVILLRPGAGSSGEDLWTSWNVDSALDAEQGAPNDGMLRSGQAQFVAIDNRETPGIPEDDRIVYSDPGGGNQPAGVLRVLDPSNFFADPADATASPVQTWRIPRLPGGPSNLNFAATMQPYIDRNGEVFFIDRVSGVGRFHPNEGNSVRTEIQAPILRFQSPRPESHILMPERSDAGAVLSVFDLPITQLTGAGNTNDRSPVNGLDQYEVAGTGPADRAGPFRGTISAGNVLYGSLTQNDRLSTTVFAETSRRQMSAVQTDGGGRMAFQVLRDGSLVMTARADGELIDRQSNLTVATGGPKFVGDPSAVREGNRFVHVFGRDSLGGLSEYQFDRSRGTWTTRSLVSAPQSAGIVVGDPRAFVDGSGHAAAVVTTSLGHLVLYRTDGSVPLDLTASANNDENIQVYSAVGLVQQDGTIYAYGTNQLGGLIEYSIAPDGGPVSARQVTLPGGRDTMVFQEVTAVVAGSSRHVFATDGNGRLVHVEVTSAGDQAENVTELSRATALGYAPYQQAFAGRVLSGLTALERDGDLFVYGTNSRDLIEFHKPSDGSWEVKDLTNLLPANRVFGAPAGYILPNGDIHLLQINEDAEVIEYSFWVADGRFHTQNITLALGNSGSPPRFPTTVSSNNGPPSSQRDDHPNRTGPDATMLSWDAVAGGASASGAIEINRDKDVFQFRAPHSGKIAIDVTTPGSDLDTRLSVLNAKGRRIAQNDDFMNSTDSHIELDVTAGRSYFVLLQGQRDSTGTYDAAIDYILSTPANARTPAAPEPNARVASGIDQVDHSEIRRFRGPRNKKGPYQRAVNWLLENEI